MRFKGGSQACRALLPEAGACPVTGSTLQCTMGMRVRGSISLITELVKIIVLTSLMEYPAEW